MTNPSGQILSLFHYTTEVGLQRILGSRQLNPSIEGIRDARHGPGQYLTDIAPLDILSGILTRAQVARRLFGQPWAGSKLDRYVEIDVTGLSVENPVPNVYLIRGTEPLDLAGRIVSAGVMS